MNKHSPEWEVMRTICEKCSLPGYVFPNQIGIDTLRTQVKVGDLVEAKCCNRKMTRRCRGFISPERATKLQNIRKRKTTHQDRANW